MKYDSEFTMTINGRGDGGAKRLPVIDPATGKAFAEAPDCSPEALDRAVESARRAWPEWAAMSFEDRQAKIVAFGALLMERTEDLKELLTREQGKPLIDAATDIMAGAYWCQAMAGLELPVRVVEDTAARRGETRRVPIGVVAAIVV